MFKFGEERYTTNLDDIFRCR